MNKNQVVYERDITASYMKIPIIGQEGIDVRILLHHGCKGLVSVERCYINGQSQFWYDISGKQALDSMTKIQALEYSLFELILLRICEQIELLEWNLLDVNGLLLDPEFIFISNKGKEVLFTFYPQEEVSVFQEIRRLVEYLLAKLDHSEHEFIERAYEIYEIVLQEEYQLQEIKETLLRKRRTMREKEIISEELDCQRIAENEIFYRSTLKDMDNKENPKSFHKTFQIEEKLSEMYRRAKEVLTGAPKKEEPIIVYPQEEEIKESFVHPTVCIASVGGEPRGELLYEGRGDYMDFELGHKSSFIGKSNHADLQIERDTISNIHAKIEYKNGYYIEDMNSTNGTFVNDEILNYKESRLLSQGDIVRFADVKYRFL